KQAQAGSFGCRRKMCVREGECLLSRCFSPIHKGALMAGTLILADWRIYSTTQKNDNIDDDIEIRDNGLAVGNSKSESIS
ncbi:MAG: hypothetical protein KIG30_07570, partial [Eubacteriales bacterium]|nr:hypothetical protein [Eubacteriales bacterium]